MLSEHIAFDGFSLPFVVAAVFAVVAMVAAVITVREPRALVTVAAIDTRRRSPLVPRLLGAAMASYIGISIFEATFALFAVSRYSFGAGDVAAAFTECSVAMIVAQLASPALARRIGERRVLSLGFVAMSSGLFALAVIRAPPLAYVAVLPLGAGMAFVGPMLTSGLEA